jgi:hypothetical protein
VSEFATKTRPGPVSWIASTALHGSLLVLLVIVSWRAGPHITFLQLASPQEVAMPGLPPAGGRPSGAARGTAKPRTAAAPTTQPVVAPIPADTSSRGGPAPVPTTGQLVPQLGDGRLWASPRPALPADVASALYNGDTTRPAADSEAVNRLRVMVDSVNRVIDRQQADRRAPSWVAKVGGKKFGIDSSAIYIAGIKIPAAVLAALGSGLPKGNFGEAQRNHLQAEMSADLLQAARRAETLEEFRHYVHEIRERKQAERDATRRSRGDTLGDSGVLP